MKKIISIAVIFCLLMAVMAGCASNEQKIIGTWKGTTTTEILSLTVDKTYTFNEDGTGTMPILETGVNVSFTYTINEDTLTIITDTPILSQTYVYTMEFEDDTLTLTDDTESLVLTKQQ